MELKFIIVKIKKYLYNYYIALRMEKNSEKRIVRKESILGINVCNINKTDLRELIQKDLLNELQKVIIAINPEKVMKAKREKKLFEVLNNADYQIADGIGIVLASKIQKGNISERITGISCLYMLCEIASQHDYRIFLYGGRSEIVKRVKKNLELYFKNRLNIVGYVDGYSDNNTVIDQIQNSNPDIIFVALGSPKQEYWIHENREKFKAKIFLGVGGAFDVISGKIKRAPLCIQKMGLEWLYRMLIQPKRIIRHIYLWAYIFNVLYNRINNNSLKYSKDNGKDTEIVY